LSCLAQSCAIQAEFDRDDSSPLGSTAPIQLERTPIQIRHVSVLRNHFTRGTTDTTSNDERGALDIEGRDPVATVTRRDICNDAAIAAGPRTLLSRNFGVPEQALAALPIIATAKKA
jgi:hypothetical protein